MRFPAFIGDIGGTNARFGIVEEAGQPFRLLAKDLTSAHADPMEAFGAALERYQGPKPRAALLAVAGRISGPSVHLTNANWTIGVAEVGRGLGLEEVVLLNDYAATAASLVALDERRGDDLRRIGPEVKGDGARVVLGPGTGLGAAALVAFDGRLVIQTTEAGHMELGARDGEECKLWALMERPHDRLSAEDVLSGRGLQRLYRALGLARGGEARCEGPPEIVEAGLAGSDAVAAEALHLFAALLGRFAGDLALAFGASGGVFIAGGIAPRIAEVLMQGPFRAEFERKHPFEPVMRRTPTFLVTHAHAVLVGLAVLAAQPERFLFHASRWRRGGAP